MPISPFVDWKKGLFLDPRKELWPFVREIALKYDGAADVVVANRSNHDFDACVFVESLAFSKMIWCTFWDLDGRTTPMLSAIRLKTKAGVTLYDVDDMKSYLLL